LTHDLATLHEAGQAKIRQPEYEPATAEQARFWTSGSRFRFLLGGNQSGKTYECAATLAEEWLDTRGQGEFWIIVPDMKATVSTTQLALADALPAHLIKEGYYDERKGWRDGVLSTTTGHVIRFKSCSKQHESFTGAALQGAWFDERCPSYAFEETEQRLIKHVAPWMYSLTPLYGMDYTSEVIKRDDVETFYIGTLDNPWLDKEERARLVKKWKGHPLEQARLYGYHTIPEGIIWPEVVPRFVRPGDIDRRWVHARALDPSANHFSCIWAACDPDSRRIVVYRDYLSHQERTRVRARTIKELSRGEPIEFDVFDSAAKQAIIDMGEHGFTGDTVGKDVDSGLDLVRQWASDGLLDIWDTCTKLEQEVHGYHRDDKGRIVKRDDHLCDALRYLVTWWQRYLDGDQDWEFC
jgi:hypothetical protein